MYVDIDLHKIMELCKKAIQKRAYYKCIHLPKYSTSNTQFRCKFFFGMNVKANKSYKNANWQRKS